MKPRLLRMALLLGPTIALASCGTGSADETNSAPATALPDTSAPPADSKATVDTVETTLALVVESRPPTPEEADYLIEVQSDTAATLDCVIELQGAPMREEIGPDDERNRTPEDGLRDAFSEEPGVSFPSAGWTGLELNDTDVVFVHDATAGEWRYLVEVIGDPALGVWRTAELIACLPDSDSNP